MVKVFELRELSMKFERHLDCEVVDLAVSKQTQTAATACAVALVAPRTALTLSCPCTWPPRCWDRRGASLPSCWQIEQ